MSLISRYNRPFFRHVIIWIFTVLFFQLASESPGAVEGLYSSYLYPVIAVINRWLAAWFPFSIGDLLYFWAVMYLIYQLILLVIHIKKPWEQLEKISVFLLKTVWIFYLSWGLNYFREPLRNRMKLPDQKYTMQELLTVTDRIIDRTNRLQFQLEKNDTIAVKVPYALEHILTKTPEGYKAIEKITGLSYKVPCIKKSLFSKQISYMKVSGYLNPFTGEAQVNKFYPKVFLPDIASHEVAHQLGFAPENEANFLGYLAAVNHPDPYFNYSGNINALYYLLIELKKNDRDLFKKYFEKLHKGVVKNFKQANEFSKRYQFPINFSKGYDAYLKLNQQKTGIQSYNEMVSLLIAYELSKNKTE